MTCWVVARGLLTFTALAWTRVWGHYCFEREASGPVAIPAFRVVAHVNLLHAVVCSELLLWMTWAIWSECWVVC